MHPVTRAEPQQMEDIKIKRKKRKKKGKRQLTDAEVPDDLE